MIRPLHPFAPVLVTGCSSGIGRATALRLARTAHPVWATARQVETLSDLAAAGCHVSALDVTDEDSMQAAVSQVVSAHGPVGALVNNAGYGEYAPVEEVDMAALRRQFETNVFGLVRLTQLVLPGMRAQRAGRIVNVSSMGGRVTLPGGGSYHASKYAVEALSDALRFELRGFGIAVSLIEPGTVHTAFAEGATSLPEDNGGPYAAFRTRVARRNAAPYANPDVPWTNTPEEVAAVIERAVTSRRPKARYLVGVMSRAVVGLHSLPDPLWDWALRTQFPTPRP